MILYCIQVNAFWVAFYLVYHFALKRETFFFTNRIYLLGSLILGMILPQVYYYHFWWLHSSNVTEAIYSFEPIVIGVKNVQYSVQEIIITPIWENQEKTIPILSLIYLLGVLIATIRFGYGLWNIWKIKQESTLVEKDGFNLIQTNEKHLPFSFFKDLYWSNQIQLDEKEADHILRHELTHIRQRHSLDIVFIKILSILFWFNPVLWFYQNAFKNIHEYLADADVLKQSKKKQYGQLLLKQMKCGIAFSFANNFNHSQLKKRFQMMNQSKSSTWALSRYLWILPVLILGVIACEMPRADAQNVASIDPGDKIYKTVDEMPIFKGCENETDLDAKKKCSQKKMLQYVYGNLKYPEVSRNAGTEGMVVAKFVVQKDGSIADPEIVKSLDEACDAEVLRVVKNMPNWNPGLHEGKKVNVFYNLPIRFKMMDEPKEQTDNSKSEASFYNLDLPADMQKSRGGETSKVTVTPNPTSGEITILVTGKSEKSTIHIAGMKGKILKTIEIENLNGSEERTVNLKELGVSKMALVIIVEETGFDVQKVTVE